MAAQIVHALTEIQTKVSYIERRIDSAECRVSDMLRHFAQHLIEFSAEAANGDLSILEGWILDLKIQFLKAGLSIGLKEPEVLEAFRVLMGLVEVKLRVEIENTEMHSAISWLSHQTRGSEVKQTQTKGYTEAVEATELTKRNLGLSLWTQERMTEAEALAWKPKAGFSTLLETQVRLAQSALRKAQALKVRLTNWLRSRLRLRCLRLLGWRL